MHNLPFRASLAVFTIILTWGCVSQKQYNELLDSKARADRENLRLEQIEKDCEEQTRQLTQTLYTLENTEGVLSNYKTNLDNLTDEHSSLRTRYDELLADYTQFQESAGEEKKELTDLLTLKQNELDDKEKVLRGMEASLYANEDRLRTRNQQIREMEARILKEQERMDSIKNAISSLLLDISPEDLTVERRGGKIYVSMSQNLLFEKNSKTLDQGGKDALKKIAIVLQNTTDTDITVEGHTDRDGTEQYNWDLSVGRATVVVQQLISNGVAGERITASGRAFFDPVDAGTDEAAKSRNRRTEIILTPKLSDIIEFLNTPAE